jgi:hypothetical protein
LEKLWHFTWKNCGISLGKIVVNTILFDIHKNYTVMNNSRVYAVISIFQRSLFAAEPLIRTSSPLASRLIAYSSNAADFTLLPYCRHCLQLNPLPLGCVVSTSFLLI